MNAQHIKKIETQIKSMKHYVTKENGILLFTILFLLWTVLYFVPELLVSLFGTLLGNLLLIVATLLAFATNWKYGLSLLFLFLVLFRFYYLSASKKESFLDNSKKYNMLSPESIHKFLMMQTTLNRHVNFDTEQLQNQVTQEELDSFLQTGLWPWSQHTTELFKKANGKNVYIRNYPAESIKRARQTYNEAAILKVLSMQTPEGIFLINGVFIHNDKPNPLEDLPSGYGNFGYDSGLIEPRKDVIKCNIDPFGNKSYMEKTHYTGKGGIFGQQTAITTPIDYRDLEKEVPGFRFLNKPCNPCNAFNSASENKCLFELNLNAI
jgi:hypothetical protein